MMNKIINILLVAIAIGAAIETYKSIVLFQDTMNKIEARK
jgi:hypothetical protein